MKLVLYLSLSYLAHGPCSPQTFLSLWCLFCCCSLISHVKWTARLCVFSFSRSPCERRRVFRQFSNTNTRSRTTKIRKFCTVRAATQQTHAKNALEDPVPKTRDYFLVGAKVSSFISSVLNSERRIYSFCIGRQTGTSWIPSLRARRRNPWCSRK